MANYISAIPTNEIKPAAQTLTPQGIEALRHIGLASHRAWCVSRFKPPKSKIPVHPKTGDPIDPTDTQQLVRFEEALGFALKDKATIGLGFSLTPRDFTYTVIDLDHCRDPKTGAIEAWAQDIVDRFDTFAEVSVSGKGIHIWLKSQPPGNTTRKSAVPNVEIYYRDRYMVVTGNTLPGKPLQINDCTAELARFYHEVFPADPPRPKATPQKTVDNTGRPDEDVIARLRRARNSAKFARLYDDGDTSEHGGDHSGADLALCNLIKIHTGDNPEQIDRIFRGSALYREKWDARHHADGATYGEGTIRACLDSDWSPVQEVSTVFAEDDLGAEEDAQVAAMEHQTAPIAELAEKQAQKKVWTESYTDVGNSKRLVKRHGKDICYSHERKQWYLWNGSLWRPDLTGRIMRMAEGTVKAMYGEAKDIEDKADRKELIRHASKSEGRERLKAMCELAQYKRPILVADLDRNKDLIACTNGTVDTRSGEFRSPRREDYITKTMGIAYDAGAQCPTWQKFLLDVMGGDAEMVRFIQLAVGYSLTGATTEQCLFFLYGSGRNGKSTFIDTLAALFGEYGIKIPTSALMHTKYDASQQEMARLPGKRVVIANETGEGHRFNEPLVKDMTGGDMLTGRELYAKTFEFKPQYKLWIYGNHKPTIRGTDEGIWRRFRLIPFTRTFQDDDCDTGLPDKLLAELPGILNWCIDGCIAWGKEGLPLPKTVADATQEYRNDMDVLGTFQDECCVTFPHVSAMAGELYATYKAWCDKSGEYAVNQRQFGLALRERGFANKKATSGPQKGKKLWIGIGIRNEAINSQNETVDLSRPCRPFSTENHLTRKIAEKSRQMGHQGPPRSTPSVTRTVKCLNCNHFIPNVQNGDVGQCVGEGGPSGELQKNELRPCDIYHEKGSKFGHQKAEVIK